MERVDLNQYEIEVICTYRNETYSVRDNGAIFRHRIIGSRLRPLDEKWTFGKPNKQKGYFDFSSETVHRIVATAYHGHQPSENHVVDHIDTNKKNNRPENLRWVTRLENAFQNPITVKRIESICKCSIEEFINNPSKYRDLLSHAPTDIRWMRTVSREEAQVSLKNLIRWAKTDKPLLGKTLGEWIFYRKDVHSKERIEDIFKQVEKKTGISRKELYSNKAMRGDYYDARIYAAKLLRSELNLSDYEIGKLIGLSETSVNLYLEVCADRYSGDYAEVQEREFKKRFEMTPKNFIQKNWGTQSEFPCCPQKVLNNPIAEYATQLEDNTVFFQNSFYFTTVIQSSIIDKGKSLLVMYEITKKESIDKRWGIMKITFENEKYVHEIIPNYNDTLEHYWLIDVKNHFKSIVEGCVWVPLYDSKGKEFKGDYMPF